MNILHIAGGDLSGGAARGTYWLHQALIEKGVNSKLIIQNYEGFEKNISGIRRNFKEKLFNRIRPLLDQSLLKFYPNKKERSFSPGCFGYDIRKHPFYEKSDIIHLHWINNAMIDVKILSKIDKPVIWTIRDMWPFTGGCHCALDCEKYATGCGACPLLNSIDENDLSKIDNIKEFVQKFKIICENSLKHLEKGRYFAVVIGDVYKNSEVIPLGFYCMDMIKRDFKVKLKGTIIKNIEGNRGKLGVGGIWRYRALNSDYYKERNGAERKFNIFRCY
ncbi:MAG: hypothetical protein U9O87_08255 [Verrucomicrobiota bacterium]|nr:hypothetical protein [Verrucomicrobiota bacterium]